MTTKRLTNPVLVCGVLLRSFLVLRPADLVALPTEPFDQPLATAVDAVGMTVPDMDRAVDFSSRVLSFEKTSKR